MNPENENFEELRRLLALKRHEQPPPGYFHNFSGQVIARIKAGERGDRVLDHSWLQRFWSVLEAKPVFAGAFGAAICAVLISGIFNSEEAGMLSTTSVLPAVSPGVGRVGEGGVISTTPVAAITGIKDSQSDADTNSVASLQSLFDSQPNVTPASQNFTLPGGY
jgi:hypothetical protein